MATMPIYVMILVIFLWFPGMDILIAQPHQIRQYTNFHGSLATKWSISRSLRSQLLVRLACKRCLMIRYCQAISIYSIL